MPRLQVRTCHAKRILCQSDTAPPDPSKEPPQRGECPLLPTLTLLEELGSSHLAILIKTGPAKEESGLHTIY